MKCKTINHYAFLLLLGSLFFASCKKETALNEKSAQIIANQKVDGTNKQVAIRATDPGFDRTPIAIPTSDRTAIYAHFRKNLQDNGVTDERQIQAYIAEQEAAIRKLEASNPLEEYKAKKREQMAEWANTENQHVNCAALNPYFTNGVVFMPRITSNLLSGEAVELSINVATVKK
jgi:glutamate synthase domain-containing protein 2